VASANLADGEPCRSSSLAPRTWSKRLDHLTFNHGVLGSSPSALTKQYQSLNPILA
jgi:hypothetical protein